MKQYHIFIVYCWWLIICENKNSSQCKELSTMSVIWDIYKSLNDTNRLRQTLNSDKKKQTLKEYKIVYFRVGKKQKNSRVLYRTEKDFIGNSSWLVLLNSSSSPFSDLDFHPQLRILVPSNGRRKLKKKEKNFLLAIFQFYLLLHE